MLYVSMFACKTIQHKQSLISIYLYFVFLYISSYCQPKNKLFLSYVFCSFCSCCYPIFVCIFCFLFFLHQKLICIKFSSYINTYLCIYRCTYVSLNICMYIQRHQKPTVATSKIVNSCYLFLLSFKTYKHTYVYICRYAYTYAYLFVCLCCL